MGVELLDVAYVPGLTFHFFSRMAAHKQGVGFMTEEENTCASLFAARMRFDGVYYSNYSGFRTGQNQTMAMCLFPFGLPIPLLLWYRAVTLGGSRVNPVLGRSVFDQHQVRQQATESRNEQQNTSIDPMYPNKSQQHRTKYILYLIF